MKYIVMTFVLLVIITGIYFFYIKKKTIVAPVNNANIPVVVQDLTTFNWNDFKNLFKRKVAVPINSIDTGTVNNLNYEQNA